MDATIDPHPSADDLRNYGQGKLDDDAAQRVSEHLDSCDDCLQKASGLFPDTILDRPRGAGSSEPRDAADTFASAESYDSQKTIAGLADSSPPELKNLPDYEILRQLGRGGMGVVYLAYNRLMGRKEVLKVMGRHIIQRPGVMDRFLREIRMVAQLRHPNIVTAYTAFRNGDSLVFAMEYVEGLDLARMVSARGPMPVPHACQFIQKAALGLEHAHENGMVHRDIKPNNLMLTHNRGKALIKVLDFGLAKASSENGASSTPEKPDGRRLVSQNLTLAGQTLGTPDFIAPEQIENALGADIRADIYSLGCSLYYLLSGAPPFEAKTLRGILQAHRSMDARPLNVVRPEVPAELAALVAKMMAKDPDRRLQTPDEVAKALTPFYKTSSRSAAGTGLDVSTMEAPAAGLSVAGSSELVPPSLAAPSPAAPNPTRPEEGSKHLADLVEPDEIQPVPAATADPVRDRPRRISPDVIGMVGLAAVLLCAGVVLTFKRAGKAVVTERRIRTAVTPTFAPKTPDKSAEKTDQKPLDNPVVASEKKDHVDRVKEVLKPASPPSPDPATTKAHAPFRTRSHALFEEMLAKEPENSSLAARLADLLLVQDPVEWTVIKPIEIRSQAGAELTVQDDGSIVASGGRKADSDTLLVGANVGLVKAIKIETSTRAAPPKDGGPFFNEYQILATGSPTAEPSAIKGRYVRIDLPGDNKQFPRSPSDGDLKFLHLAEMQVFQGGRNIALGKSARQSSTYGHGSGAWPAERGVDGNTSGLAESRSMTHTAQEPDWKTPWWEVDLGSEQRIDRMVIWNRTDADYGLRMSHFRIRVLDASRNVVSEQFFVKAPQPSREIKFRVLASTSEVDGGHRLSLSLLRNPREEKTARFRVSVSSDQPNLTQESRRAVIGRITDPWVRLGAAYVLMGDQRGLESLVKTNPAVAVGFGDVYAAAGQWDRAIAEYRKGLTDRPANGALLSKLAAVYVSSGRTREAVPVLARLSAVNPKDHVLSWKVAILQAWFGSEQEFAGTRQRMLAAAKDTNDADVAARAAEATSILPISDKAELRTVLALARKSVTINNRGDWTIMTLGMAEYRNGNNAAANEALLAAAANTQYQQIRGISGFFRAMAHFRQGKRRAARQLALGTFAKMKPLPADPNNPLIPGATDYDEGLELNNIIMWLAYKEAKALIKFDAPGESEAEGEGDQ